VVDAYAIDLRVACGALPRVRAGGDGRLGARRLLAALLLGEAALRARRGEIEPAIETWSRAEALAQELGDEWDPEDRLLIKQLLEPLRLLRPDVLS
jgi:hypothetical protein